jgi:DNA-binding FadR family transcriptional regulator
MTETFGVSRTVIREALASLAADGLVEPRQGAGVFVLDHPTLTLGSMSQEISKISQAINVLEVRMGIEVEASGLAATRRNAAQVALIQEAFFEFERVLKLGQPTGKADFAFHREIASATNNPLYVEMLDALGDRTIPCDRTSPWYSVEVLSVDYLAKLQREHLLVLKAISAGDAAAAREAMRAHLVAAQARYSERLVGQQAEYLAGAKR